MKIGFLFEHPTWSQSLIECFAEHGCEVVPVNIADLAFDTDRASFDFDLCVNRINMMPSAGRHPSVAAHTLHFLHWLEASGIEVINGAKAHFVGASKAVQNGIFERLGLGCPKSVAIHSPADALQAAERVGYPVIVKPNIGGSGSGIAKFETADELQEAVENGALDLGIDGTGLIQEYVPSDGYVYRVEILGGELFYGIRQKAVEDQFNYCAADGCSVSLGDDEGRIETHDVPADILQQVIAICDAANADVGGVEYFIRADSGAPCFYDFNPYSNFVGEGEALFGFSPEQRFVDFVLAKTNGLGA